MFCPLSTYTILVSTMAQLSTLFFKYLTKEFAIKFMVFTGILLGVVFLFDMIELIRRGANNDAISLGTLFTIALYKLPDVGQQILPFSILFAAIATLRSLSDRRELVCIRSAGLSAWQFLLPLLSVTLLIGLLYITVLNPLAAASMAKYESLNNLYFGDGIETITVINDELWIRQQDETGNFILKARELNGKTWVLNDISVYFFDADNKHLQRIDADTATLKSNEWVFEDVAVYKESSAPAFLAQLSITTNLTAEIITESFSNPQTLSFWRLPYFIGSMDSTGLDTTEMRIYYQSLLSLPLLLTAMIFVAAIVTLRTIRVTTLLPVVIGGLGLGFLIFFISSFLRALGMGQEIPIILAVWTTPIVVILCSVAFLAQMEDG